MPVLVMLTCAVLAGATIAGVPPPMGPPPYSDCDSPLVTSTALPAPMTPGLINRLVQRMNSYRRNVTPGATQMPMLRWNEQLALGAAEYIAGCTGGHSTPTYRQNATKTGFFYVSENLATGQDFDMDGFMVAVDMWGDERTSYTYTTSTCALTAVCGTCAANQQGTCGHYTVMVWANSTDVGCAYQRCNTTWEFFYACWFGRGGNIMGMAPYIAGPSTNTPCVTSVSTTPSPGATTSGPSATTSGPNNGAGSTTQTTPMTMTTATPADNSSAAAVGTTRMSIPAVAGGAAAGALAVIGAIIWVVARICTDNTSSYEDDTPGRSQGAGAATNTKFARSAKEMQALEERLMI